LCENKSAYKYFLVRNIMYKILTVIFIISTISISASKTIMHKDLLLNNEWIFCTGDINELSHSQGSSAKIKFQNNSELTTLESYGEDLTIITGRYLINNDKLKLSIYKLSGHSYTKDMDLSKEMLINTECQFVSNNKSSINSLLYNSYYKCDNGYYIFNNSDKTKINSEITINSIPVLSLGLKKGVTTENVKIRENPDIKSKSIIFNSEMYGGNLPSIPKGAEISIIARTIEKNRIGSWDNYWYYVNVGDYYRKGWVWMYGEFIKITGDIKY
jgi:hypothetical protein